MKIRDSKFSFWMLEKISHIHLGPEYEPSSFLPMLFQVKQVVIIQLRKLSISLACSRKRVTFKMDLCLPCTKAFSSEELLTYVLISYHREKRDAGNNTKESGTHWRDIEPSSGRASESRQEALWGRAPRAGSELANQERRHHLKQPSKDLASSSICSAQAQL